MAKATKKIIISDDLRDEINNELRSFGLALEGASRVSHNHWWVTIKKVTATYNEQKVADLLMSKLGAHTIVLDGKLFVKSLKKTA